MIDRKWGSTAWSFGEKIEAGFQYPYRRIELLTLHLHTTQARLCYLLAFVHYNMEIAPVPCVCGISTFI